MDQNSHVHCALNTSIHMTSVAMLTITMVHQLWSASKWKNLRKMDQATEHKILLSR